MRQPPAEVLGERGVNNVEISSRKHTPQSKRGNGYHSRPQSIQRNASQDVHQMLQAPSYLGGGARADQSALDHIRRIRRNVPSQQNSRMSHDFSYDYLSAKPVGHGNGSLSNNSKIENYKRIKQEEAAARAQLIAPASRESGSGQKAPRPNIDLGALAAHRRNPSLLDRKYKPSENALKAYSPLRNELGGH